MPFYFYSSLAAARHVAVHGAVGLARGGRQGPESGCKCRVLGKAGTRTRGRVRVPGLSRTRTCESHDFQGLAGLAGLVKRIAGCRQGRHCRDRAYAMAAGGGGGSQSALPVLSILEPILEPVLCLTKGGSAIQLLPSQAGVC